MSVQDEIKVGLVGAAGRGGSFADCLAATGARIHAVCDTNEQGLDRAASTFGVTEKYHDFEEMLLFGTPLWLCPSRRSIFPAWPALVVDGIQAR